MPDFRECAQADGRHAMPSTGVIGASYVHARLDVAMRRPLLRGQGARVYHADSWSDSRNSA